MSNPEKTAYEPRNDLEPAEKRNLSGFRKRLLTVALLAAKFFGPESLIAKEFNKPEQRKTGDFPKP